MIGGMAADPKDLIKVTFKLTRDGADDPLTPRDMTWPVFKEFMDALTRSLASMRGGPSADEIVPLSLTEGSACHHLGMRRCHKDAVYRFRRGQSAKWSAAEIRGTRPIYGFLQDGDFNLSVGMRRLKRVIVPSTVQPWVITEHTTLYGQLNRLGGKHKFSADIDFDRFKTRRCSLSEATAHKMRGWLFGRVAVTGILQRHSVTRDFIEFDISDGRLIEDRLSYRAWHERAMERGGLDPEKADEFLKDYR